MPNDGPLRGLKVLELGHFIAGPFCTRLLGDLGALVVKAEPPGQGDPFRGWGLKAGEQTLSWALQARNKKCITLNLKHAEGQALARRLVRWADVVVENFRPGVMARLGLGYDDLKQVKPDLIYCAISGFGQDGPLRANPAYDQIIQGLSGVMSVTGSPHTAPLRVGYPVCDTMGGITAAFAIAAALFRRSRTGAGEAIDTSMLEATLVAMGWAVSNWLIAGVRRVPRAVPAGVLIAVTAGELIQGRPGAEGGQRGPDQNFCQQGGHPHALVPRPWEMLPLAGARLTLTDPAPTATYTGMLPGHIAGHYPRDALEIDLVRLARHAGAL